MVLRFSRFFHTLPFSVLPGKKASALKYEKVTGLVYVDVPKKSIEPEGIQAEFHVVEETPEVKIGYRTSHGESFPAIHFKIKSGEEFIKNYPIAIWLKSGTVLGFLNMFNVDVFSSPGVADYVYAAIFPFLTLGTIGISSKFGERYGKVDFIVQTSKCVLDVRSREILEEFRKAL